MNRVASKSSATVDCLDLISSGSLVYENVLCSVGLWQALLEALLVADRGSVIAQVVGVPTGMQALVDLLDDR